MPFLSRTMRCNPPSRRAKLLSLFETLARGRRDFPLCDLDAAQVDWIVRSGLGPLCFHAAKELLENSSSPHWSSLKAADLTARMIAGEHLDAMREIIDASAGCVPRLTLLKGISVAAECYPEFQNRASRDPVFGLSNVLGQLRRSRFQNREIIVSAPSFNWFIWRRIGRRISSPSAA